jgi:hypothetical protein
VGKNLTIKAKLSLQIAYCVFLICWWLCWTEHFSCQSFGMLACLVVGYWAGIAVRVQIESWNSWPLSGRWLHVTSGRCTLRRTLVTRDIHQKPSPTLTESVALERIADRVQLLLSRCVRAPDSILQFTVSFLSGFTFLLRCSRCRTATAVTDQCRFWSAGLLCYSRQ